MSLETMPTLSMLIDQGNDGNLGYSLLSPGYGDTPPYELGLMPTADPIGETGGSIPRYQQNAGYPYSDGQMDLEEILDKQADGWTGPSLDQFTGVSYAGLPGYGIKNDQPAQSATTNLGGWSVPSEEVGIGRDPGWRWAHMPHVVQNNPRREAYADQGVFADGMPYFSEASGGYGSAGENRTVTRNPIWQNGLTNLGMSPDQRYLAPGSAIIEQPPGMSLSQILGDFGVPGWGVA